MQKIPLPTGIDDFKEIVKNYYYIDKTSLIEQVLENGSKVSLFTRPRRFGKSLNMSMLQSFFEIGTDPSLFDNLYISKNTDLCEKYFGKYPVIFISLKGIDADSYEKARAQLIRALNREARRFQFLLESDKLTTIDKKLFLEILDRNMEEDAITSSLQELTELLEIHYNQKVIVLIDEYDVPLAKAHENGYYDKMVLLIRNLFGNALKTNTSLAFAVLTGCLRIAKESIFTGLNNMKVLSVTNVQFDEVISKGVVVIDFFANWCGPCKMIAPIVEELDEEMSNVKFIKVDVDKNPQIANQYKIVSIPTLKIFKDGKLINTLIGFKTKDALKIDVEACL